MNVWSIVLLAIVAKTSAKPQLPIGYQYLYVPQYTYRYQPRQQAPRALAPRSLSPRPTAFAAIGVRAAAPVPAAVPVPPAGSPNAASLAIIPALPHTGITGFADNLGAGIANFGNGQGASIDALVSGSFNAAGVLLSGILGSGAVNTAFQNFNNKPPPG